MSNIKNMTTEQKVELYHAALDAYEAGEPIMSDEEYDLLVGELNRENEAEIGSVSKSSSYTTRHSIIMGSLDKVHMTEDKVTKERNYAEVLKRINQHLSKSPGIRYVEMSPKFDGCSFSYEFRANNADETVATRGDGSYGVSIKNQFKNSSYDSDFSAVGSMLEKHSQVDSETYDTLIIRGEALMDFMTYNTKWSNRFKNLRVAVSGTLNKDYESDNDEYRELYNDITYMCYDYRLFNSKTKKYLEIDWMNRNSSHSEIAESLQNVGVRPEQSWCRIYPIKSQSEPLSMENLIDAYEFYEDLRDKFPFPIDGIVVRSDCDSRLVNNDRVRPEDAIAIKFITKNMSSVIKDIEWSVGRNEECYPVAILEPVYQDGKEITRASLHGYSYLLVNKVGVGSRVNIVMNGDIIPGVESVESEGKLKMPDFPTYVKYIGDNKIPHLMRQFTDDEKTKHLFINSAKALQVEGIKEQTAEKIYDALLSKLGNRYENLMDVMCSEGLYQIWLALGESKSTQNIVASLENYRNNMTLADVVRGCGFPGIGKRFSKVVESYILEDGTVTDDDITYNVLEWLTEGSGPQYSMVYEYADTVGLDITEMKDKIRREREQKKIDSEEFADENIAVILTGDPSKCTAYKTKKEWLNAHPHYKETTKWSECSILFTNDIESKTGKMAKAVKNGIEIRLYED